MLLKFTPYAQAKMIYLRDVGDTEVSFLAITPNSPMLVEDVLMVPQKCSAAYTEMKEDGLANFQLDMVEAGLQPNQFMRIWCHTHPGDGVTPSNTDETTFREVFGMCDWAIMFILGKAGSTSCRFSYRFGPGGFGGPGQQEIGVAIDWKADFKASDKEAWKAEYDKNWSKIVYATGNNWQSWNKTSQFSNGCVTPLSQSGTVSGNTASKHHSAIHVLNPKSGLWEPIESGSRRLIGFREEEYKEPISQLTKREKKYLAKHGSLKGYVAPTNNGRKKLDVIEKIELIPFPEEERTSSAPRMMKLEKVGEKLEAPRNLLDEKVEDDDFIEAQELVDELITEAEAEIEKLELKRDVLEELQMDNFNKCGTRIGVVEEQLEQINLRLAEAESELELFSREYDAFDDADDTILVHEIDTPVAESETDKEWLDEAAAAWMDQEVKNHQQQMEQQLQDIPDLQVKNEVVDNIMAEWPSRNMIDRDEDFYNYYY